MSLAIKLRLIVGMGITPLTPLTLIWRNSRLIKQLAVTEIQSRYKSSVLGIAWSIVTPLLSLLVFTFVFTTVLPSRWPGAQQTSDFSLLLFVGLIIFTMFADIVNRAPGLLLENVAYLNKVVFPVEVLSVVSVVTAAITALFAFLVFLIFHLILRGLPPLSAIFLPLVLFPFALLLIGLSWFLSATGIYLRDLRHIVAPLVSLLMFLSPIFFPSTALPPDLQPYLFLNPLTFVIEESRRLLLDGKMPDFLMIGAYTVAASAVAYLGLMWFMATRRGFADVV
jgi:lipopolysaccharide transport system permease protein